MTNKGDKGFAPVREVCGVAIMERDGNHRAVWQGQEYTIDGNFYLFGRKVTDKLPILYCTSEQDAVDLIESMDQAERDKYMSRKEALALLTGERK